MVKIPKSELSTVSEIYKAYEEDQAKRDAESSRGHLGASGIGADCARSIWYGFRWATVQRFDGRMLRLFETGNLAEARFTADLRRVGVDVQDVDPATGKQFRVRDSSGHFGGALDGEGVGFLEAPKTVHVLEYKTHNDKSFKELIKLGVVKAKPMHFAQMQTYMHFRQRTRAFYLAVNKNTDELYQERVYYDIEFALKLVAKAQRIINNPNPPERITEDETWFQCRLCNHADVCRGKQAPPRHCRSCIFSTPVADGQWHCDKHKKNISLETQKNGCQYHRYLPSLLVGATQVDAEENGAWIEYLLPDKTKWRDEGK